MQGGNIMFLPELKKSYSYVVGLDASLTSFGVYMWAMHPDLEDFGFALQTDAKSGLDTFRQDWLYDELLLSLNSLDAPVDMVVIEDYGQIGRASGKFAVRCELVGAVKRYLRTDMKVNYAVLSPNGLKKVAHGKGAGGKPLVVAAAAKEGYNPETSDEVDAYFCAKFAHILVSGMPHGVSYVLTKPVT